MDASETDRDGGVTATELDAVIRGITPIIQKQRTEWLIERTQLLDRIVALEAKSTIPGPAGERGPVGERGEKGEAGLQGDTGPAGQNGSDGANGKDGQDAPVIDIDEVALRAAELVPKPKDGVDGRDGQPGAPGAPGRDGGQGERGEKGSDGKDGRDGTLEGASIKQLDDRTWQIVRADGSVLGELKTSAMVYRGIYRSGDLYEKGDCVTRDGSLWVAREATQMTPGQGATPWQLAAKAGRDGREGKPGPQGLPGSKGERGEAGRNFS